MKGAQYVCQSPWHRFDQHYALTINLNLLMTCLRAVSGFSGGVPSIGVELDISVRHIICDCCESSHLDRHDHL